MGILKSLNRSQKEAIGLLQIGTFLEYFDLMLYVHMAVVLNSLFFPKTDPHTAALLAAFAFCSTYILRPFGALIFGWIGDNIGRKSTVIITTMMMSLSCIIMANLPTYAEIGIWAAVIVTCCRLFQGLSSMGEIIGAQVYVTEITQPPIQYPAVALISLASTLGAVAALGVASLVTHIGFNWRIAFWIGATVAVVGSIARIRLRETPEFLKCKKIKEAMKGVKPFKGLNSISHTKKFIAFTLIHCGYPLSFYLIFLYFNVSLVSSFAYTPSDIIFHNFFVSIVFVLCNLFWVKRSYKNNPLGILRLKSFLTLGLISLLPILMIKASSPTVIFIMQSLLALACLNTMPAEPIFIKEIPVLKRFTATSLIYASSRAAMYITTSFGLVYLTEAFGHYGLWIIALPVIAGFLYGVSYFEKLEKQKIMPPIRKNQNVFVS